MSTRLVNGIYTLHEPDPEPPLPPSWSVSRLSLAVTHARREYHQRVMEAARRVLRPVEVDLLEAELADDERRRWGRAW